MALSLDCVRMLFTLPFINIISWFHLIFRGVNVLPSDRPITIFFLVKAVALAKSVHIVYTNYQIWIIDINVENQERVRMVVVVHQAHF